MGLVPFYFSLSLRGFYFPSAGQSGCSFCGKGPVFLHREFPGFSVRGLFTSSWVVFSSAALSFVGGRDFRSLNRCLVTVFSTERQRRPVCHGVLAFPRVDGSAYANPRTFYPFRFTSSGAFVSADFCSAGGHFFLTIFLILDWRNHSYYF